MSAISILSVAGSDSGGGAGIQADLRTFAMFGCHGTCAITALTAQNTLGVNGVSPVPPEFVAAQIRAVREDIKISAAKTGMLFSREIVLSVAKALSDKDFPLVVDPVLVSKSGANLLLPQAVQALKAEILPLASLVTPNLPEAELLSGMKIFSQEELLEAGRRILELGARAVLLKGGHVKFAANPELLTDWLCLPGEPALELSQPRVDTPHTHGTGCTLSAAIAAGLGLGLTLEQAVRRGQGYLNLCLGSAFALGRGVSPVDHLAPYRLGKLGQAY